MSILMGLALGLGGVAIGAYGTLIGIGGGVIIVPLLLFLYPAEPPRAITAISMAVVLLNSFSGTFAYNRLRRVDYRSGIWFSLATVPGTVLGVLATFLIGKGAYQSLFGLLLVAVSLYIFFRPAGRPRAFNNSRPTQRLIVDRGGVCYQFCFDLRLGIAVSFGVGFFAGLFGIGGGIIQVPLMVSVLGFPAHIATATSQFILLVTTFFGTGTHIVAGDLDLSWPLVIVLGAGVMLGAQVGAKLSLKVGGTAIIRLLAAALLAMGLRLVFFP